MLFWLKNLCTSSQFGFMRYLALFFVVVIWFSVKVNPILALSAAIGSMAFFITDGFKKNAEMKEKEMLSGNIRPLVKFYILKF